MKHIILLPVFILCLSAGLRAEDDCAKSADACRPQIKKLTPFMAEITKAQKPPESKQVAAKETVLKQGAAKETTLKQGEPKARPAAVGAETTEAKAVGGAPEPPARKEALSKPAWLLAVGALLAGLYYFLKDGKARRKRA